MKQRATEPVCSVCGRPASELEAFGGAGDPTKRSWMADQLTGTLCRSTECRDCIIPSEEEYFERRDEVCRSQILKRLEEERRQIPLQFTLLPALKGRS